MTVIDVHTHMFTTKWLQLLQEKSGIYNVQVRPDGQREVFRGNTPVVIPQKGHFDWALRIEHMDAARIDVSVVSLTCPNVYWGGREVSLQAARIVNDDMAAAQTAYPSRLRWLCSLPWEYPDLAVAELARACDAGAVGVMVLANVAGRTLADPLFAPIWAAIDRRALPVLVHPTAPPGTPELALREFNLIASIGFMFDTSLAVARLIFDGFLDRYPDLKLIVSHAGAALPYLVGRLDQCFDKMNAARTKISTPPSEYMRRLYYDSVTYRSEALAMCIEVGGADRVLYGSDYPHNIGDMKGCLARVDELPPGPRQAVRGGNARRIFRL